VVCDDVYNLLYFTPPDRDGKSPKRLFAYDDKKDPQYKGNVVSNGSFSKIFSPGVRLGWLEAPKSIVDTLYKNPVLLTGGAFNHTMSHVIVGVMRLGLMGKSIEEMRETLQMKRDALCDTLSRELPSSVIFERPKVHTYVYMSALLQLLCVCVCSFHVDMEYIHMFIRTCVHVCIRNPVYALCRTAREVQSDM
jgi:DNA-binding transcriptional MocR family regulator